MNQCIVGNRIYTLSFLLIRSFSFESWQSVSTWATVRKSISFKWEKDTYLQCVQWMALCEGTTFSGNNFIFLSKGFHMEINSGKTKAVHLNMYKLLGAKSGAFLEWDGSFDERLNGIFVWFLLFLSTTWLQSKKNWFVQPKSRYSMKKQHAVMDFWINQHQVIFLAYRM